MKSLMDQTQFQHYCREQSYTAETRDLGAASRISGHHVRRLEQLGYTVTLTPAQSA